MSALSLQSCPTLQPYGLQPTRVLRPWGFPDKNTGWLTMPSSRGASQPRDQAHVSCDCCIAGRFFITWATQETHIHTTISSDFGDSPYLRSIALFPSLGENWLLHSSTLSYRWFCSNVMEWVAISFSKYDVHIPVETSLWQGLSWKENRESSCSFAEGCLSVGAGVGPAGRGWQGEGNWDQALCFSRSPGLLNCPHTGQVILCLHAWLMLSQNSPEYSSRLTLWWYLKPSSSFSLP